MDEYITRAEHEEFCRRMDTEHKSQERRIGLLEESVSEFRSLAASVERLAGNMENMLREQKKQGERLEALEGRDGEMWRKAVAYTVTAVIGAVLGFVFTKFGLR